MGFFTDPDPLPEDREVPRLVHRDRYDRPLISQPDSGELVPYTRASTMTDVLCDHTGLTKWKTARAMVGIGRRPELMLEAIGLCGADDEVANKLAYDLGSRAASAGDADMKANLGTAIAAIVERHLKGETPADAGPWQPTVDAVLRVLGGFEVHGLERFVVHDELCAAGSYDYYASPLGWMQLPGGSWVGPDDPGIIDLKTAQTCRYFDVKFEAQIGGVYHDASPYRVVDSESGAGERYPWSHGAPRWALILHAPAGLDWAQLRWVDVEAGRRSARRAVEQRRELAESKKRFAVAGPPVAEAPAEVLTDWQVRKAIHACRSLEGLRDLCVAHQAAGQAWPNEVVEWAKAYAVRQGWLEAEVSA
jgi:hypothetical protein